MFDMSRTKMMIVSPESLVCGQLDGEGWRDGKTFEIVLKSEVWSVNVWLPIEIVRQWLTSNYGWKQVQPVISSSSRWHIPTRQVLLPLTSSAIVLLIKKTGKNLANKQLSPGEKRERVSECDTSHVIEPRQVIRQLSRGKTSLQSAHLVADMKRANTVRLEGLR